MIIYTYDNFMGNDLTGDLDYLQPDTEAEIHKLLKNLEVYTSIDEDNVAQLLKMAVMHYQFENIHTFYYGNCRTDQILNILYLMMKVLLNS